MPTAASSDPLRREDGSPTASADKAGFRAGTDPGSWIWYLPIVGLLIWALGIVTWIAISRVDEASALSVAASLAAFFYGGKLAAVPVGIAAGGDPRLVATFVLAADIAGLFLFYPFTQVGVDRWLVRWKRLERWIRNVQTRAQGNRIVARFGPFGLFLIALIPFSLNTPILDAFIGRVAGFRTHQILTPILAEMTLMNIVWTLVFGYGLGPSGVLGRQYGYYIAGGVLAIVTAMGAVSWVRRRRARRRVASQEGI